MIWVRKAPQDIAARPTGIARAFNWLIFQTCFFGIAIIATVMISSQIHPAPVWLQPMLIVSLTGFAGGIVGAFIAFGVISAQDEAPEE
jgi:hypothetical protein